MPTISLDSIRESIERKYEPLVIPFTQTAIYPIAPEGDDTPPPFTRERSCTLVPVMRLDRGVREQLVTEQRTASAAEDGKGAYDESVVLESLRRIIRLVASDPDDAAGLIDAVGDDLAVLSHIVETYSKDTQAGEA